VTRDEALAWAYLSRVVEPPCAELATLVASEGPVDSADRIRRAAVGSVLRTRTEARRDVDCAAVDLDVLARLGGRLVVPDDEWPQAAFAAPRVVDPEKREWVPPLVLWAVGPVALTEVTVRSCAVVGTRASTAYGDRVTADITSGLVERDMAIVSGAAYGVDGSAHRAALAADGITVAVLAGGIDVPYPSGHSGLLQRISAKGLVVSEYPPGLRPARHRFLTRNRIVAALGAATVVVEAGLRSGAASTAAWAESLNRPVCAVPGPVTSSASNGCHALIRNGATLVTRAQEIVELAGSIGELAEDVARPTTPLDGLSEREALVFEALPSRGARSVEQVAVAAGLPPVQVLGPLATLELAGLVARVDGRWKLARGVRARPA
jgi:DNA processing protein